MIIGDTDGLVKVVAARRTARSSASTSRTVGRANCSPRATSPSTGKRCRKRSARSSTRIPSLSEAIGETMLDFTGRSLHG